MPLTLWVCVQDSLPAYEPVYFFSLCLQITLCIYHKVAVSGQLSLLIFQIRKWDAKGFILYLKSHRKSVVQTTDRDHCVFVVTETWDVR